MESEISACFDVDFVCDSVACMYMCIHIDGMHKNRSLEIIVEFTEFTE